MDLSMELNMENSMGFRMGIGIGMKMEKHRSTLPAIGLS
jgi:hypothetical protein